MNSHKVLAVIAKKWKQPKKWINKTWYLHIMEYYSGIKRNELQIHAKTWKNIKITMLRERSQTKKEYILNDYHFTKF